LANAHTGPRENDIREAANSQNLSSLPAGSILGE
jgi:hypothetical protein